MTGKCAVADAHCGDLCECRLKRCHKLALEHAVDAVSCVFAVYIAADVGIEEHRVCDFIGIFAVAADRNIDIKADILIDDAERNRARCAVFVAEDFLCIEEINALITSGFTAHGETLADVFESFQETFAKTAIKHARFCGLIVDIFACFCTKINDLALIDDDHALPFVNGDDAAVADDVFCALGVGTASGCAFLAFNRQNIFA